MDGWRKALSSLSEIHPETEHGDALLMVNRLRNVRNSTRWRTAVNRIRAVWSRKRPELLMEILPYEKRELRAHVVVAEALRAIRKKKFTPREVASFMGFSDKREMDRALGVVSKEPTCYNGTRRKHYSLVQLYVLASANDCLSIYGSTSVELVEALRNFVERFWEEPKLTNEVLENVRVHISRIWEDFGQKNSAGAAD